MKPLPRSQIADESSCVVVLDEFVRNHLQEDVRKAARGPPDKLDPWTLLGREERLMEHCRRRHNLRFGLVDLCVRICRAPDGGIRLTMPRRKRTAVNCPPVLTTGCIPRRSAHKRSESVMKCLCPIRCARTAPGQSAIR